MLHAAKTKGMITALAHLEDLPFRDNCFDRILLVDAFHHLRDQETASRELIRVLKPSGRLLIEEPDCGRLPVKIAAFLEKTFSFPSGHSTIAVSFYGFITYVLWRNAKTRLYKIIILTTGIILMAAIGFSRLYLGVHFLSDVIAGYLLGIFWVTIGIGVLQFLKKRK